MACAWFMSTASGFSIITGMWRGAHAATTLTCEKVSVKVATASGFAVSSMLSRLVKSRSLPRWFDEAHFASSAASGSQTATMTTSAGRLCAPRKNAQTWLRPGAFVEAEVAVEAVSQVVAVEQHRHSADIEQPLLDSRGDGRLAGAREPGEPECRAAVAQRLPAPLTAHPRALPADVRAALCRGARCGPLDLG